MLKQSLLNNKCPFLQEPMDDCYCTKMNSQDVEKTIFYCGKNFETCEIYKKNTNSWNNDGQNGKSARGHTSYSKNRISQLNKKLFIGLVGALVFTMLLTNTALAEDPFVHIYIQPLQRGALQ